MNLYAYIKQCFVRQIKLSISVQYEVQKIMKVMIMSNSGLFYCCTLSMGLSLCSCALLHVSRNRADDSTIIFTDSFEFIHYNYIPWQNQRGKKTMIANLICKNIEFYYSTPRFHCTYIFWTFFRTIIPKLVK